MSVYLIRKATTWDIQGQRLHDLVGKGLMSADEVAYFRLAHDEHMETLKQLRKALTERGIPFEELERHVKWVDYPERGGPDFVITVGGDGTVLAASHRILNSATVLFGVRSSHSSVGHLCRFTGADAERIASAIAERHFESDTVRRFTAKIQRLRDHELEIGPPLLNDLLFAHRDPAGTTRYFMHTGDQREFHRSSGIWMATAMGSTGAICAAGGQPQDCLDRRLQFAVRELFVPRGQALALTRGFLGEGQKFSVECRTDGAILAFDGQHGQASLGFGDKFEIAEAPDLRVAR